MRGAPHLGSEEKPLASDTRADGIPTLVVDDEPVIRDLLELYLTEAGCRVQKAADGRTALDLAHRSPTDLVFTDVRMPGMSGLDLLESIRAAHPEISIVILSGYATIEDTVRALRLGALDFLHKPFRKADVLRAVNRWRRLRSDTRAVIEALSSLLEERQVLEIPSNPDVARPVAALLTRDLTGLGLCGPAERDSVALALHETLLNAIIHGNLGIPSTLKSENAGLFDRAVEEKRNDPAWGGRRVRIEHRAGREGAEWSIEDEGEGFDHQHLPDPSDPESLMEVSGRGLLIVRLAMDEVSWNDRGNRIRLALRPRRPPAA